jgi:hypothetical protein
VFLVEVCLDDDTQYLEVFPTVGALVGFLGAAIRNDHYTGDGYIVRRMFSYAHGTFTPLTLHRARSDRAGEDFLDWHYELHPTSTGATGATGATSGVGATHNPASDDADAEHSVAVVAFSVRIDGRA